MVDGLKRITRKMRNTSLFFFFFVCFFLFVFFFLNKVTYYATCAVDGAHVKVIKSSRRPN